MKSSIILFYLLIFISTENSFAQGEKIEIKIIDSSRLTKSEMYVRAKIFLANSFNNFQNVLQMDDKDAGVILCKGNMDVISKGTLGITYVNNVDFTFKMDIKEGKYRATLTNLKHMGLGGESKYSGGYLENEKPACGTLHIPKKDWAKMKDAIKIRSESFLELLRATMKKEIQNDDF